MSSWFPKLILRSTKQSYAKHTLNWVTATMGSNVDLPMDENSLLLPLFANTSEKGNVMGSGKEGSASMEFVVSLTTLASNGKQYAASKLLTQ